VTQAVSVLKIGGSVLTGHQAYRRAAAFVGARLCAQPGGRLVAVVSAELGATDSLLAAAREIVEEPERETLDLLWATGELRSAALLVLSLQAIGVRAAALNIHQTGLVQPATPGLPGASRLKPLRLRAVLAENDVVVAPGFLACGAGDAIVSLGRGGSDLTAVLLAAGLGAARCELLKDVPGYFTADPKRDPDARPLAYLTYSRAIQMADDGCQLVQRQALEAARDHSVPLFISAMGQEEGTLINAER
jgi:aspartate kinase